MEFLVAAVATLMIVRHNGTLLYLPFWSGGALDLGYGYLLFGAIVIVGFGNAVNLTDGLDGLASMPVIIACLTFMIFAYLVRPPRIMRIISASPMCRARAT